jgi:hypothetical protein
MMDLLSVFNANVWMMTTRYNRGHIFHFHWEKEKPRRDRDRDHPVKDLPQDRHYIAMASSDIVASGRHSTTPRHMENIPLARGGGFHRYAESPFGTRRPSTRRAGMVPTIGSPRRRLPPTLVTYHDFFCH